MTDRDPERRDDEPHSLDDWLRQFFTDSILRPVLVVAAGSLAAMGAGIIAWAVRDRNWAAIAALVLLAAMSADALLRDRRRRGRLGLASRCILGLWGLSGLAAAAAVALGLA
ncbi:MAG: hypothetical protein ACREI8_14770 [Myxococcota bacterium]